MFNLLFINISPILKSKYSFLKLPLALFFLCFLASCENDSPFVDTVAQTNQEEEEILDYLASLEVDLDSVKITSDVVYLNYDSGIMRKDLLEAARGNIAPFEIEDPDAADFSPAAADRQNTTMRDQFRLNALTRNNVNSILYFIRPSVFNDLGTWWHQAVSRAANDWTNLSNCRISFTRTFNQAAADIIVASSSDNILPTSMQTPEMSGAAAKANIPFNGVAGGFISINENNSWATLRKKNIMIHEFGHTVGFSHTNQNTQTNQEVHGTPTWDSYSMMQPSHFQILSLLGLSAGDIRMARVLYPDNYARPTNFTADRSAPGEVKISYKNPNPVSRPYYWIRVAKYNTNGNILETRYTYSRTNNITGNHTLTWGGHATNTDFQFALRGCNFRRDVWSSRTPQITVNLN